MFGPIPIGRYTLSLRETKPNWIDLIPDRKNVMHERSGFGIHRRGPTGSHGCIVPYELSAFVKLIVALRAREAMNGNRLTLRVFAEGLGVDAKFYTA